MLCPRQVHAAVDRSRSSEADAEAKLVRPPHLRQDRPRSAPGRTNCHTLPFTRFRVCGIYHDGDLPLPCPRALRRTASGPSPPAGRGGLAGTVLHRGGSQAPVVVARAASRAAVAGACGGACAAAGNRAACAAWGRMLLWLLRAACVASSHLFERCMPFAILSMATLTSVLHWWGGSSPLHCRRR